MSIIRKKLSKLHLPITRCYSIYKIPSHEDSYNKNPLYPPILDLSKKATERRQEETWYKKIERQKTVEEKLFEINVPRYWGWKCLMLKEGDVPYNSLRFIQYVTKTCIDRSLKWPERYQKYNDIAAKLSKEMKSSVEDELSYHLSVHRVMDDDSSELEHDCQATKYTINALNRVLMRDLCVYAPHLSHVDVDYSPRIEAFWSIGGLDPPDSVRKRRKEENKDISKDELDAPINRWVQYLGSPLLQVRHEKLLEAVWDETEKGEVPEWTLEPAVLGFQNEYRHGTSIPGFWPGSGRTFGLLSYHSTNQLQYRPPSYGTQDQREAELAQAILASFGWLSPLAAYRGFSPFSNVTYPTLGQSVLTDGRRMTFIVYQLNTNALYSENATNQILNNFIWCTEPQNLYEKFENGKIKGLNEDVLAQLISMYLNEPVDRPGVNLRPYLGENLQRIADYEDDEKRCWLESQFKHFSSNRPRHRVGDQFELYEWERIYKVEHQRRPMDPRRRPFELREHPYRRKMSDTPGVYIPKSLRPDKDLPKWRQKKFAKTYFPE